MIVEINKDIDKYQETVAMGLTARQLLFSLLSILVGGGLVLLLHPYVGFTVAAYIIVPIVIPIALGGFYSYNGMSFYEVMKRQIFFLFRNKTLLFRSTERKDRMMISKGKRR